MTRSPVARCLLLALALVAGCDWAEDDSPAWTQVGASVYYDYAPGPDSLHDYTPYAPIPPTRNAMRVRVEPAPDWSDGERVMIWDAPGFSDAVSPFYGEVFFPMENEDLVVTDRGLEVVIPARCHNGISHGWTSWVRVPREPADVRRYAPCSLSPGALYRFGGIETVVTPAGTFDAFVLEVPRPSGEVAREHWSWDAGLVQLDVVNAEGVLRGRFSLSSR